MLFFSYAQVYLITVDRDKMFRKSKAFWSFALESQNIKNIIGKSIIFSAKSTKIDGRRHSFSSKLFRLSKKLYRLRRFFFDFTVYLILTLAKNNRLPNKKSKNHVRLFKFSTLCLWKSKKFTSLLLPVQLNGTLFSRSSSRKQIWFQDYILIKRKLCHYINSPG